MHLLYLYIFNLIWLLRVSAGRQLPEDGDQPKHVVDR